MKAKNCKKALGRKGKMFPLGMSIVLIVVLVRVLFLVVSRMDSLAGSEVIGKNQISLYNSVQHSEKVLLYEDMAFSASIQQAVYDAANEGGLAEPKCGKQGLINLWRASDGTECFPKISDYTSSFSKKALETLNSKYLNKNPYIKSKSYNNNHEIFVEQEGENLVARAYSLSPISGDILCYYGKNPTLVFETEYSYLKFRYVSYIFADSVKQACGFYFYRPDLMKKLNFSLADFEIASDAAKAFSDDVQECVNKGNSTRNCVFEMLPKHTEISSDCSEKGAEIFTEFIDEYTENLESDISDCTFFYAPPQIINTNKPIRVRILFKSEGENTSISVYTEEYNPSANKTTLWLTPILLKKITISGKGPYLAEYYNDSSNPPYIPSSGVIQYILSYDRKGKLENQEVNYHNSRKAGIDWDIPGNIMFYKQAKGNVSFIDTDNYDAFMGTKICKPEMERSFNFCYDTGKKVLAKFGSFGMQPVKIIFGLSFGESNTQEQPAAQEPGDEPLAEEPAAPEAPTT